MTKTYEVGIYNKYIRDKVRNGDEVGAEESAWEETHYFDVEAESEAEAKKKIMFEYKPEKGFVIDCINVYRYGG
tara:strand:+ start:282 stop:503 length:222 start_codon:yes stop_codon:yes gene_type:complete